MVIFLRSFLLNGTMKRTERFLTVVGITASLINYYFPFYFTFFKQC